MTEQGTTIWEKLGASAGAWAALWLAIQWLILRGAHADPASPEGVFVRNMLDERMSWEWATLLRLVAGLTIIWFMGSLAGRLRLAEGEPGRLASIANSTGVVWGAVWLLSAFFNSASILLATLYNNPAGARLAGVLGRESALVLTPSIIYTMTLAVAFVAMRFGGFPKWYGYATAALNLVVLVLALADWYGPGNLAPTIMVIALAWTAMTSVLIIPAYRPADMVRGSR
jgi:hypothetical protein